MLKTMMLAGAALIATPAIAQDMQTPAAPTQEGTAPMQGTDTAPAQGQPATTEAQVAQVVEADWAKYDTDGNGELSQDEFAGWLGALRKASEPGADMASTEMQGWMGQAFAAADADKSSAVTKEELTSFLSQSA
ncbi:calcium-binding protein [Sphingomonas sp. CJ99]